MNWKLFENGQVIIQQFECDYEGVEAGVISNQNFIKWYFLVHIKKSFKLKGESKTVEEAKGQIEKLYSDMKRVEKWSKSELI